MTARLEDLLEPGEPVLYRDPRQVAAAVWVLTVLALGLLAAGAHLLELPFWMTIALALVVLVHRLWDAAKLFRAETLVTDRRVLQSTGGRSPEFREIPLEGISKIEFFPVCVPGYVKLTARDGEVARLYDVRRPQPFCRALAQSTDLPCPPLVGRLENTADYCVFLGGFPLTGALFVGLHALFTKLAPAGMTGTLFTTFMLVLFALPTLYVGLRLGIHLAGLLSLPILRPFVTFEELQNWLCIETEDEKSNRRGRRWRPLYSGIVALLWGRPIRCADCGGPRHGG